jgi:phosphocarrier protein
MSEPAFSGTVVVANRQGLHVRSAAMIVKTARQFNARVALVKGLHQVNANDVWEVLSLAAKQGDKLRVEAGGPEARQALEAMQALFLRKFDEED